MSTTNDEILRATGGPTINEGLSSHFSRTTSESLWDAERRWLAEVPQSATPAVINDMWFEFLRASLFTGALNDMKFQYWSAQP